MAVTKKQRKCTNLYDRFGNLIYENDRCRSWHFDELHPEGGFWLFEVVRFYKGDWYLFVEGHEYKDEDDQPVLLKEHLYEIELFRGNISVFTLTKPN